MHVLLRRRQAMGHLLGLVHQSHLEAGSFSFLVLILVKGCVVVFSSSERYVLKEERTYHTFRKEISSLIFVADDDFSLFLKRK